MYKHLTSTLIMAFSLILVASNGALSQGSPGSGIVYNTKEHNSLVHHCTPQKKLGSSYRKRMTCEFTQTSIRPLLTEYEIDKEVLKGMKNFKTESKSCNDEKKIAELKKFADGS
ncbi:hypothetical protein OAN59_11920, partial [Alphaproteobacteria bacterium]|nr:hypothetical protein [Alphaproteobacteria bacterium]